MLTDFLLASLHHVFVFTLFVILGAEIVLVRPGMDASAIARVARIDAFYGLFALGALLAGTARVIWGAKGYEYYLANHIFWTKLALFVAIGLLSIPPTLRFAAWRRAARADARARPDGAEMRRTRIYVHAQATLIILLPILAAAMARGYGVMAR
jgi:putative membrane protein